jgi:hypothetical protein
MQRPSENPEPKRDWRVSLTLGAVWFIALAILLNTGVEIPVSMLLLATVFFVLLIPTMNDLVRSIERISKERK